MAVLGIDIGFGFTKATDGNNSLIFKSLYGEAAELQFWANFADETPTDHIHVTIDGESYFVGDLAEQQSSVLHYTLDQERLITQYVKILALTVAGMFIPQGGSATEPFSVVSGLPIGHFKENHDRFNELLTGHHTVVYHSHDGKEKTKEVHIDKVRMLPQPMGSLLNRMMDDSGKIFDIELAGQKVGVVDIGFRTTDFAILDRMRYINRGSKTIDTGISKGFSVIAGKLQEKCNVNVELYRLYQAAETGSIKMRGHGFSFAKVRDQVYSQLASSIANEVSRLWADDWDIDTIILSGGGCRELAPYLQPMIVGNVVSVDLSKDPRLNNVLGYLKYGRYTWPETAADSKIPTAPVESPVESKYPQNQTPAGQVQAVAG